MQNFRRFILLISYKSCIFAVNYMQMSHTHNPQED